MENNDLLKEQAKRLRQVKDEITLVNNATSRSAGMGGTIAVATTYTGSFEALVVNEDAVIDILTGGFYTITIQNQYGTEKVSKDIISKVVSIDPDSTIEILESNKFNYRGKMTWHQIVDSLIFKGFEQNPEFDKKCGSNSYESEETSK